MNLKNAFCCKTPSAGRSIFNTLFTAALLTVSASVFAGSDADDGLQVDSLATHVMGYDNLPIWQLTITSLEDDIVIQSFTLNRGNCLISYPGRGQNVNKHLGYGQTLTFSTPTNATFTKCKPLELTIQTSKGEFTYNW